MAASPIRISVELDAIEPTTRFQAALDELAAAAAELVDEDSEVTGFLIGDDIGVPLGRWNEIPRPGTKSWSFGVER